MNLKNQSLLCSKSYIAGQWVAGDSGATFPVLNPATGETIIHVADCGAAETERAVSAADEAFGAWKTLSCKVRADILRSWYNLIMANQEDLAQIMTAEQGKVLFESRGEIAYAASFIEWFAEEAKRTYGDVIPEAINNRRQIAIKQPVGVVGAVTPWNFPSAMITRKAGPALAAGCSFVCKPASETPLSALALCVLAEEAGVPKGVLSVVTGKSSRAIGAVLTESPLIKKFTFTGSTPVGKQLIKQCASTVKKVSMELGGNAPVLVFDDADLEAAVAGAIASKYRNAGQTCICANRILVQAGIYDAFVEKFVTEVKAFKLGDGANETVTMGPVITPKAVSDIHNLVEDAVERGANLVVGGQVSDLGEYFYEPAVLTNVDTNMRFFKEEIFGPVAPIFRFDSEAEGVAMANDTEFGLAAYFYTQDMGRIWRVGEALEYGMVGANEVGITNEMIPFGGIKESGLGREGSKYGMDDYLEIKYLCLGGI